MSEKSGLQSFLEKRGFKKKSSESKYDFYKRANGNGEKVIINTKPQSKTAKRLDELRGKTTANVTPKRKSRGRVADILGTRG